MRLLVTRPQPDGERTAEALRAHGHHVIAAALLRMEPLDWAIPDQRFGAVVITSANAARAIQRHPRISKLTVLPAFTVGEHTAQAARLAGFATVHSADGNRNDLADMLQARMGPDRAAVLYLAGEDRAGAIELLPCGATVLIAEVYRMVKLRQFPLPAKTALKARQVEGVLHFSRRSAETYLECAQGAAVLDRALEPIHYCLSRQVAAPLATAGAASIRIASHPDEAAMIELVISPASP